MLCWHWLATTANRKVILLGTRSQCSFLSNGDTWSYFEVGKLVAQLHSALTAACQAERQAVLPMWRCRSRASSAPMPRQVACILVTQKRNVSGSSNFVHRVPMTTVTSHAIFMPKSQRLRSCSYCSSVSGTWAHASRMKPTKIKFSGLITNNTSNLSYLFKVKRWEVKVTTTHKGYT